MQKEHTVNNWQEAESSYPSQEEILDVMTDIREKIHNVAAKNISKAQACQAKNYNPWHKGETLKVGDKIMKKNKKAEWRKGDKLGPRWLGPYLITDVHENGNYMVANPKTGKVLATRCPQSECKLYIDLVLGTTEKHYQDALDKAKKLEPQYQEPLASAESVDQGKQSFYNAQISLQYTSISCITYRANKLIEHTFISCQFNKQVYCFVYFQASEDLVLVAIEKHYQSSESADQGK